MYYFRFLLIQCLTVIKSVLALYVVNALHATEMKHLMYPDAIRHSFFYIEHIETHLKWCLLTCWDIRRQKHFYSAFESYISVSSIKSKTSNNWRRTLFTQEETKTRHVLQIEKNCQMEISKLNWRWIGTGIPTLRTLTMRRYHRFQYITFKIDHFS